MHRMWRLGAICFLDQIRVRKKAPILAKQLFSGELIQGSLNYPFVGNQTMPRWWFQSFFISPLLGEMIQFDEHIFQMGGSTTNQMQMYGNFEGFSALFGLAVHHDPCNFHQLYPQNPAIHLPKKMATFLAATILMNGVIWVPYKWPKING